MRYILLITLVLTPLTLDAQQRHGFWFNGGLGWGSLGCDNCNGREGGLSGGLSLGGTLSPKFLLGVGTTGWTKDEGGARLTTGTFDARMRFYPSETGGFFLTAGLGVGTIHASVDGFGSETQTGFGAMLGLGVDLRIGNSLSLTPFWNGFAVRNNTSDVNVGQIGLSLTVHKFQEPERVAPVAAPPQRLITPTPSAAPAAPPAPAPAPPPPPAPEPAVAPAADTVAAAPLAESHEMQSAPFVGDTRLKLYYPSSCAAKKGIPSQFKVLFQSSSGAQRDGFKPSGDC